jgi:hypothetical protein
MSCAARQASAAASGWGKGNVEAHQQVVARHAEDRAVMAVGGFGQDLEVFIEQRHHAVDLRALGESRETAQIGEQHHHVDALRRALERRDARFEIGHDAAHEPR